MDNKLPRITMVPWKLLGILLVLLAAPTYALDRLDAVELELLQPDQAFAFTATARDSNTLQASWKIADGYYMYRERIRFSTDTPGVDWESLTCPPVKSRTMSFSGKLPYSAIRSLPRSRLFERLMPRTLFG
jgi:thiol:disulfide interchange protein DsbD